MPRKTSPSKSDSYSIKVPKFSVKNSSYAPLLMILLLLAAFFLGRLTAQVQYLQKGATTTTAAIAQAGTTTTPAPGQKVNVDPGHLPLLGNKNAKVTVIEFADFQCPFCEQWLKNVEPSLIKDYVNTGKVKFAFRHYAFLGQESTWAAEASECANEQGKFWDYHDYLYNNQGQENSGTFTKDKLIGFATTLGLNTDQFSSCLSSDKYAKNVSDDLSAGQKAGVSGTPSTFVDGQIIVGAQPYATLKQMIDAELAK